MTVSQIAERLAAYCSKAEWEKAHNELYAKDAKSTEPYSTSEFEKVTTGLEAIKEKGKKFDSMVDKVHSIEISQPLIAGNTIAFTMAMDVSMKGQGRMKMPELCVYQVKEGKIISEEFFV